MFSNIALLGTPKANRAPKQSLEFTPIGRGGGGGAAAKKAGRSGHSTPLGPANRLNQAKVHNKMADSSFAVDDDNFSATINSVHVRPPTREPRAPSVEPAAANPLVGGMTSIKEQQLEFQRIETENYNLKIKLATLTRYLEQTPADQRALVDQNMEMKQQLVEAARELERARDERRAERADHERMRAEYERARAESGAADADKIDQLKSHYVQIIQQKEWDLEQARTQMEHLQSDHGKTAEVLAQHEFLQDENQRLRRELESATAELQSLEEQHDAAQRETIALRRDVDDKDAHMGELHREIQRLKDRYEALNNEYRGFSDSKHDGLASAKEELIVVKSQLDEFKYKYESTKSQLDKYRDEVQHYMHAQDDGRSHSDQLSHQLERAQRELERTQRELKDKDKAESSLRAQLEALVREKSGSSAYASQIEGLQESEHRLAELNKKLRHEVAQLRDELFQTNTFSNDNGSKVGLLQREVSQLKDKLQYYENQYELMEKAFHSSESDVQVLKDKLANLNLKFHELEQDNIELSSQLKNTDLASSELDNIHRQRLEADRARLQQEVEDLTGELAALKRESVRRDAEFEEELRRARREESAHNADELMMENRRLRKELELASQDPESDFLRIQISKLKKELQQEMAKNEFQPAGRPDRYLETEYQRILVEKSTLQAQLESTMIQVRDLEMKNRKLQYAQDDKDGLIEDLERKLRDAKRSKKYNAFDEDDEKTELLMSKANSESKIRLLELEKSNLKKDCQSEIGYYKNKVDVLSQKSKSDDSSIVALLEKQLEEAYKARSAQSKQLSEGMAREEELRKQVDSLKTELHAKLESKTSENSSLQELLRTSEKNEQLLRVQISELELKIRLTQDEVDKITRHCETLVDKVADLNQRSTVKSESSSDGLQKRLDELNNKLSRTSLSPSSQKLQDQVRYYRAKLYDMNLRVNDLHTMYTFVMSSLRQNNDSVRMKHELLRLGHHGFGPDASARAKPTFAVVAKMVLAAVRIKRRSEKADLRTRAISELRSRIDM